MILKNCRIYDNNEEKICNIEIQNGKIADIFQGNKEDNEIIDIEEKWVLPGIIDVHTHMRDPGLTQKECIESGSKAAARGGVTTFLDMPNTIPNTITEEILIEKEKNIKGRSYVDYGFHFGGSKNGNIDEIKKVKSKVASTKIFLNMSTGDMLVEDEKIIEDIFKASKIVSVHAEEGMVRKAIELAEKTRKKLYICHVSRKDEIEEIKKAKEKGVELYAEATPHHIIFDKSFENEKLLMKPPLQSKEDKEALIKAIEERVIDTIGTDHAPHLLEEKLSKKTFGIPGIENSLEMILNFADRFGMKTIQELMSENPAKIFGIKNKGKIEVGYDADLVVVDLNKRECVSKDVFSKCGWTPYEGMKTGGKIEKTYLRGILIYDGQKVVDKKIGEGVEYI